MSFFFFLCLRFQTAERRRHHSAEDFSLAVGPPQIVGAPSLHAAVQTAYRR